MKNFKTKNWINKASIKHNYKYSYDKSIFINSTTKLIITCREHGDFEQNPANHLNGVGCPKCGKLKNSINRTKDNQYFIEESIKIHGNKYSYDKTNYIKSDKKLIITCNEHGDFEQIASNHINGAGCPKCNKRLTTTYFIEESIKIHGNTYSYEKTNYIKSDEKLIITCKEHGDFEQLPHSHLNGHGCQKCNKISFEKLVHKFNDIHHNKYKYYIESYINTKNKIKINCEKHGDFEQYINNHLNGYGCPKCLKLKTIDYIFDDFINKANKIHNNKYTYHNNKYINSHEKINIQCLEHGEFQQQPNNHLQNKGCPKCSLKYDKTQNEIIDFIKSIGINNIIVNDRKILNGKELDIYLPDYNLAIEYNGLYWHSDIYKDDNYHNLKTEICIKNNINLIHIFEDEWLNKSDIVKSRLKYLLNKIESKHTIYGRYCYIKEISDNSIIKKFLEENHLQGYVVSKINLGLYYFDKKTNKEYLVGLMTFGNLRKNLGYNSNIDSYELLRYVSVKNYRIIGGANKLLKYFERKYKPKYLLSFADRRWSFSGNLYTKLNFKLLRISKPNYFYIDGLKRINRFNYRKDILVSKYGCNINDTERNFMKNNLGLNRIYDSGNYVFEKIYTE